MIDSEDSGDSLNISALDVSKTASIYVGRNITHIANDLGSIFSTNLFSSLKSLIFGSEVTKITRACFINCSAEKIELPEKLDSIEAVAFSGAKIKHISFDSNLRYIGKGAFSSTNIDSLNCPESLEEIDDDAFSGSMLKYVRF